VDWLKLEPRPDVKNPGSWKYGAKYFATIEKSEN
jgi:hypothetical protein